VFESAERLREDVERLTDALRQTANARAAFVVDTAKILFASAAEETPAGWAGRGFQEARLARLFELPASLEGAGPEADVFEGWDDDEFLIAVLNGRVALVLFCPDAERARAALERPFATLADRLLRWRPALAVDPQGRGLFVGRPRVDWIVVGRA
jgi:hypothetical protein